jgi:hypothetical protein
MTASAWVLDAVPQARPARLTRLRDELVHLEALLRRDMRGMDRGPGILIARLAAILVSGCVAVFAHVVVLLGIALVAGFLLTVLGWERVHGFAIFVACCCSAAESSGR